MKLAAIDIGTNAMRLLLYNVYEEEQTIFKKIELIRMPVRLGEDVFTTQKISNEKIKKIVKVISGFKLLMEAHEVMAYKVLATSAMREAENGKEVIDYVFKETGVEIQIIDGRTEAKLILSNQSEQNLDINKYYLFIDVGGGSTELSFIEKNGVADSHSFNIGTVRMLYKKVNAEEWEKLKSYLKKIKKKSKNKNITIIGSGGNINKIFKISGLKEGKVLKTEKLREIYNFLSAHSYQERIEKLGLNPDRADVIIPACEIFLYIAKLADIKDIMVPKIGLSDGIIREIYNELKAN